MQVLGGYRIFYRAMQTYGLQIQRPNHDFGNACPANAGIKKISSILLFFFFAFVSLRAGASLWLKKITIIKKIIRKSQSRHCTFKIYSYLCRPNFQK
jgi:hypothetical protein